VSPFLNGKKNPIFVHPNFKSQFVIGKREPTPIRLMIDDSLNEERKGQDPRAFHVKLKNIF
jgi:hypothetical protein